MDDVAESGILPGEPVPVRLMNTIWADRRGVRHDSIATRPDLAGWLQATDLAGRSTPVTGGDLTQARLLRDALRILAGVATAARPQGGAVDEPADKAGPTTQAAVAAADVTGEAGVSAAVAAVNAIAAAGYSPPRIGVRGGRLIADTAPAGPPVAAALSVVAMQAIRLLTDPESPLRACHAPGCVLYFVRDHPRREWCSAGCGNRARAARHYRRHRARSQ
jgi:Putative stress-induced transcription regulator/CGNR zinc finger